jgi:peptidoglycan hydrolase CwlO-like protein
MKNVLILLPILGIFSGCATHKDVENLQVQIDQLTIKTSSLKTSIESLDSSVESLRVYTTNLNNQVIQLKFLMMRFL